MMSLRGVNNELNSKSFSITDIQGSEQMTHQVKSFKSSQGKVKSSHNSQSDLTKPSCDLTAFVTSL